MNPLPCSSRSWTWSWKDTLDFWHRGVAEGQSPVCSLQAHQNLRETLRATIVKKLMLCSHQIQMWAKMSCEVGNAEGEGEGLLFRKGFRLSEDYLRNVKPWCISELRICLNDLRLHCIQSSQVKPKPGAHVRRRHMTSGLF